MKEHFGRLIFNKSGRLAAFVSQPGKVCVLEHHTQPQMSTPGLQTSCGELVLEVSIAGSKRATSKSSPKRVLATRFCAARSQTLDIGCYVL
jgi:hypothetical protein